MREIQSTVDFRACIAAGGAVIVWFTATWCKPCKTLVEPLDRLATYVGARAEFVKVDVTKLEDVAVEFEVGSLPAFYIFKTGVKVDAFTSSAVTAVATKICSALDIRRETPDVASTTKKLPDSVPAASSVPTTPSVDGPLNVPVFPGGIQVTQSAEPTRTATELARTLNGMITSLFASFVGDDGKTVNYVALRNATEFHDYVRLTAALQTIRLDTLSQAELKAFCLNIYNAMVIHTIAVKGPANLSVPGSLGRFFKDNGYTIGGAFYSMDDIEHGVLRCNAEHPTTKSRYFQPGDSRLHAVMAELDPRIHFAVVCGAKGCPPVRMYSSVNLDYGLESAAALFCDANVIVDVEARKVTLSKIFEWYGKDFGPTPQDVLRWILPRLSPPKQADLVAIMEPSPAIEYAPYDWSTNGVVEA